MSYDIIFRHPKTGKAIQKPSALLDLLPYSFRNDAAEPAEMWLTPTYNYGAIFSRFGINPKKNLNGLTAKAAAKRLLAAFPKMGDDAAPDYYEATEGNAKRVAMKLLAWCALAGPDAILCEES